MNTRPPFPGLSLAGSVSLVKGGASGIGIGARWDSYETPWWLAADPVP
jgi:hypothetical protein